jgi:cephalosporin hydroxylase
MGESAVSVPLHKQRWEELTIGYADDPDPGLAGIGMVSFPLIRSALGEDLRRWVMSPAEQAALIFLLEHLRPKVAIEIGTHLGGSLQALSKYCEKVYAIDVDPDVPKRLDGAFQNVEYLIGKSSKILPELIKRLQNGGSELAFVLVNGDHHTESVRRDINELLCFRPTVPLYIAMHDSFNPECRAGIRAANWSENDYVHAVEVDFVPGFLVPTML